MSMSKECQLLIALGASVTTIGFVAFNAALFLKRSSSRKQRSLAEAAVPRAKQELGDLPGLGSPKQKRSSKDEQAQSSTCSPTCKQASRKQQDAAFSTDQAAPGLGEAGKAANPAGGLAARLQDLQPLLAAQGHEACTSEPSASFQQQQGQSDAEEHASMLSLGTQQPDDACERREQDQQEPNFHQQHQEGSQGQQGKACLEQGPPSAPAAVNSEHLQQLIDEELGPPKFSTPKPNPPCPQGPKTLSPNPASQPGTALPQTQLPGGQPDRAPEQPPPGVHQECQVDESESGGDAGLGSEVTSRGEEGPHLQLEVLTGIAAGRVVRTSDILQELRIGRLPDCTLSLGSDQEVSGRHAVIHFSEEDNCWMLTDVGSLNGTSLNGMAIGREYRKVGDAWPLADGDCVEFGLATQARISCTPAGPLPPPASAALARTRPCSSSSSARASMRGSADDFSSGSQIMYANALASTNSGRMSGGMFGMGAHTFGGYEGCARGMFGSGASSASSRVGEALGAAVHAAVAAAGGKEGGAEVQDAGSAEAGPAHCGGANGPPTAAAADSAGAGGAAGSAPGSQQGTPRFRSPSISVSGNIRQHPKQEEHEGLGLSLAVHQRVGTEHKRSDTGCEDVVHWEMPFLASEHRCALFCVFDGHNGVQAANKARELLPGALHAKLMQQAPCELLSAGQAASSRLYDCLRSLFLEVDALITLDEGCTATLVLVQRTEQGSLLVQSANVGDSSAVLVDLTHPSIATTTTTTTYPSSSPSPPSASATPTAAALFAAAAEDAEADAGVPTFQAALPASSNGHANTNTHAHLHPPQQQQQQPAGAMPLPPPAPPPPQPSPPPPQPYNPQQCTPGQGALADPQPHADLRAPPTPRPPPAQDSAVLPAGPTPTSAAPAASRHAQGGTQLVDAQCAHTASSPGPQDAHVDVLPRGGEGLHCSTPPLPPLSTTSSVDLSTDEGSHEGTGSSRGTSGGGSTAASGPSLLATSPSPQQRQSMSRLERMALLRSSMESAKQQAQMRASAEGMLHSSQQGPMLEPVQPVAEQQEPLQQEPLQPGLQNGTPSGRHASQQQQQQQQQEEQQQQQNQQRQEKQSHSRAAKQAAPAVQPAKQQQRLASHPQVGAGYASRSPRAQPQLQPPPPPQQQQGSWRGSSSREYQMQRASGQAQKKPLRKPNARAGGWDNATAHPPQGYAATLLPRRAGAAAAAAGSGLSPLKAPLPPSTTFAATHAPPSPLPASHSCGTLSPPAHAPPAPQDSANAATAPATAATTLDSGGSSPAPAAATGTAMQPQEEEEEEAALRCEGLQQKLPDAGARPPQPPCATHATGPSVPPNAEQQHEQLQQEQQQQQLASMPAIHTQPLAPPSNLPAASRQPQGRPPMGPSPPMGKQPGGLRWVKLSADHRISSSAAERARLQERGHAVRHRLFGLNISRMLGDRFLKDEDLGFIAEPHVSEMQEVAAGGRAFLVMASDGLWDVVAEQRAATLVSKAAEEQPGVTAADVADILLSQAITLRSKDDISILVVEIKPCAGLCQTVN